MASNKKSAYFRPGASGNRLFLEDDELPRIRSNAHRVCFRKFYLTRRQHAQENLEQTWQQFRKTNSIYFDLRQVWNHFGDLSLVHLVEPTMESRRMLLNSIERLCELPAWDHLREAGETLG